MGDLSGDGRIYQGCHISAMPPCTMQIDNQGHFTCPALDLREEHVAVTQGLRFPGKGGRQGQHFGFKDVAAHGQAPWYVASMVHMPDASVIEVTPDPETW